MYELHFEFVLVSFRQSVSMHANSSWDGCQLTEETRLKRSEYVINSLSSILDEPEGNTDGQGIQREVNIVMKTPAVKATREYHVCCHWINA